jgi:hypothetical protein
MKINMLIVILCSFIILSQVSIFIVREDVWFDPAFSLQTVNNLKVNGINSIDFSNYDVHPGTYYYTLYFWSFLNPGISEMIWARELSVIFGILFLVFAYKALKKIFGRSGEWAVLFLAIGTTMIHYSQEIRMYMLIMCISSMMLWCIVEGNFGLMILGVFLFPNIQYFGGMASLFFPVAYFIYWNSKGIKKWFESICVLVSGLCGIAFALFRFAIPQLQRIDGTWFQLSNVSEFPSSLIYSVFYVPETIKSVFIKGGWFVPLWFLMFLMLVFVMLLIPYLVYLLIKNLWKGKIESKTMLMMLMGSTAFAPLFALMMMQSEKLPLYHHRFFLVVTWMFAAMCFVLLSKWLEGRSMWWLTGVLVVFALMFVVYDLSATNDLQLIEENTPCPQQNAGSPMIIVHDSAWSMFSFEYYGREHRCWWENVITTELTERQGRSAGYDALRSDQIYRNMTLPKGDFFYVRDVWEADADMKVRNLTNAILVYQGEGIDLQFVRVD